MAQLAVLWAFRTAADWYLRKLSSAHKTSNPGTRPGAQCSPDPDTFNPVLLDTDQWARAFASFGCREAVLVVKHNCGFVTVRMRPPHCSWAPSLESV